MDKVLEEHFGYLSDTVKLARYEAALEKLIQPDQVVLDLGCGTGILGLMALRNGAKKVYFVEEGAIIEAARQQVKTEGFSSQAEFLQKNSFNLTLPEQIDVVVCDHVGCFGFDYGLLSTLHDAAQRFLAPGGILVPRQLELLLAPVESDSSRQIVARWSDGSIPQEFSWLAETATNTKYIKQVYGEELIAEPASLATLQCGDDVSSYLKWNVSFQAIRDGEVDGLAGFFRSQLFDDIFITNSPSADERMIRPTAFMPLPVPVIVRKGERIDVNLMVRHRDNVIGWVVDLPEQNERFAQNTFNGRLLDAAALARVFPERVARLNDRGRARQIILAYCDGDSTLAEVEASVKRDHPDLFPTAEAASAFIMQVLAQDTEA